MLLVSAVTECCALLMMLVITRRKYHCGESALRKVADQFHLVIAV